MLLLCSIAYAQNPASLTAKQPTPVPEQGLATYVLGPGDTLTIRALNVEEISEKPVRIGTSGVVKFPMIGPIKAAGMTLEQLETEIVSRLKGLVNDPDVAVVVTEYRAGITAGSFPFGIAAGPDGNLWFTEQSANRIGKITPAGVVTEYSAGISAGSGPGGIAAGPDGNLWFTETQYPGDHVGKITPAGVVTEYHAGISASSFPYWIATGRDGNLWFTEQSGNRIGKITPAGVVTEYSAGRTGFPLGIAAGPDGNLWFTKVEPDRIGKITPAGVVTLYRVGITAGSRPFGIAAGPDGNLWFTEDDDRVGKITPSPAEATVTVTVTVTVKGKGRITGGGITCPARCKATIAARAKLTLRASAARGYRFAGWSGACTGLHACTLHPKAAVKITATFRKRHS